MSDIMGCRGHTTYEHKLLAEKMFMLGYYAAHAHFPEKEKNDYT
jgi:hypothetical protein